MLIKLVAADSLLELELVITRIIPNGPIRLHDSILLHCNSPCMDTYNLQCTLQECFRYNRIGPNYTTSWVISISSRYTDHILGAINITRSVAQRRLVTIYNVLRSGGMSACTERYTNFMNLQRKVAILAGCKRLQHSILVVNDANNTQ